MFIPGKKKFPLFHFLIGFLTYNELAKEIIIKKDFLCTCRRDCCWQKLF